MNNTTKHNVAEYFLWFAHEHGDCLTNLKLQKLMYYAQAWHLALYDDRLFDGDFEAWIHGPVLPAIYHKYKAFGWSPIGFDIQKPDLSPEVIEHLDNVLEVYLGMSAYDLERLTHSEDPWIKARGNLERDENSNVVLSEDLMKAYYGSQIEAE